MSQQAGEQVYMDPGKDRPLLTEATAQCCHCSRHFVIRPGSGKIRGFCQNCCGLVCSAACAKCVPFEQLLFNIENGLAVDHRPAIVFVGSEVPGG